MMWLQASVSALEQQLACSEATVEEQNNVLQKRKEQVEQYQSQVNGMSMSYQSSVGHVSLTAITYEQGCKETVTSRHELSCGYMFLLGVSTPGRGG